MISEQVTQLFAEALQLAAQQFYIDAIPKFLHISQTYSDSELADDALFNAGMCYFYLNTFEHAIQLFNEVIEKYPDAELHQFEDSTAFGKTAAKCHYAILNSYLGMGQYSKAEQQLTLLNAYTDAYELTPLGEKLTYLQLGQKALESYTQFKVK